MRNLFRNRRTVYYALRTGERELLDANGHKTGEIATEYGAPVKLECNVSASAGQDATQAFGSFADYNRTITVADVNCPIDENSIVWFGVEPSGPHNYIVVQKADSKNGVLYALQKVAVQ